MNRKVYTYSATEYSPYFHHVTAKQHQLSSQCLSSRWHSRDGGHPHLDINTLLPYLFSCSLGNFSHSIYYPEQTPTAWAHVLLPLYALCGRLDHFPLLLCPKSSAFFGSMTGDLFLKPALSKYFSFTHYAAWPQGLYFQPQPLTGTWQSAIPLRHSIILTHRVIRTWG